MRNLTLLLSLTCLLTVSLSISSCSWFKKVGPETPENTGLPGRDEEVNVYKMDTIQWKEDSSRPPVTSSGQGEINLPPVVTRDDTPATGTSSFFKENYDISVLLPFYTDRFSDSAGLYAKSQFALEYYAGVKLALDSLNRSGMKLHVNVWDTQKDYQNFEDLLNNKEVKKSDIIIGPAEKDNLPVAAAWVKGKEAVLLSPYYPSLDIPSGSPRFVQANPSLRTHCERVTQHILTRYTPDQVVMICRDKDNEASRFRYYQDALISSGKSGTFREVIVLDESATLFKTDIASLYKAGTTVFVVPSWQESFVLALLRKIDETRGNRNVVVYGMPQWLENDQLSLDYYQRLQLRIPTTAFVQPDDPRTKAFLKSFYHKYGKIPGKDAILGYDTMLMLGRMLGKYGTGFPSKFQQDRYRGIQTGFWFQPVSTASSPGSDRFDQIEKYENAYIFILKLEDYSFKTDE